MGQRLGRFITKYRTDYFQPDKRNGQIIYSYKPLPYAEDAIYKQISDITISMKATDHLKMPELVSSEYAVRLSDEEKQKYTDLKQELVLSVGDAEITAANAASLSSKLSQMANGAIYDDSLFFDLGCMLQAFTSVLGLIFSDNRTFLSAVINLLEHVSRLSPERKIKPPNT